MEQFERSYLEIAGNILFEGHQRQTRNAVTRALSGQVLVIDELTTSMPVFPIIQSRQMYPKGVLGELAAFLKGPKNVSDFEAEGCNYWKQWAGQDGDLNLDYGNLWLNFEGVNQVAELIDGLKADPYGRRHIISGWHPGHLKDLSLPCCHMLYQWVVIGDELEMIWYQRSADWLVGVPSDIILAAMMNLLVAQDTGLRPGRITMVFGDAHIYEQHFDQAAEYLERANSMLFAGPGWTLDPWASVHDFSADQFQLHGYTHDKPVKFEVLA